MRPVFLFLFLLSFLLEDCKHNHKLTVFENVLATPRGKSLKKIARHRVLRYVLSSSLGQGVSLYFAGTSRAMTILIMIMLIIIFEFGQRSSTYTYLPLNSVTLTVLFFTAE